MPALAHTPRINGIQAHPLRRWITYLNRLHRHRQEARLRRSGIARLRETSAHLLRDIGIEDV